MARVAKEKIDRRRDPLTKEDIADLEYRLRVLSEGDDDGASIDVPTAVIAWANELDLIPNSELERLGFGLHRSAAGVSVVRHRD